MDYPTVDEWREIISKLDNCKAHEASRGFAQGNFHEVIFETEFEGRIRDMSIYMNAPDTRWREDDGMFNLSYTIQHKSTEINVTHLEKYFIKPLSPTEDERQMFQLEVGVEYPVFIKGEQK